MRWALPVVLLVISPSLFAVHAQAVADSLLADSTHQQVTPLFVQFGDTLTKVDHKTKSPGLAMLFSAVVPGGGQFYNESYWKVPVVLGFGVYFASQWLHNNRLYKDYRDKYTQSLLENPSGDGRMLQLREFYKDQRDTFTWYFAILYFVNIADAYVDASLYEFDVSGDLSIKLMPAQNGLALRMSF